MGRPSELDFALETVTRAGALVVSFFQKSFRVREKSRNNPVTSADLAADTFLREAFTRRFSKDGWLSEETADDSRRLGCRRVWVVDPLDGTREFVRGLPEFALSVALVEDGRPILAVVSNPATGEFFYAQTGTGVFRNGTRTEISKRKRFANSLLLMSRSENAQFRVIEHHCRIRRLGSIAYKLALVAAGEADITMSFQRKNEWDVCAGALLVLESGGAVTDLFGNPLQFNQESPGFRNVVAANPSVHAQAVQWIASSRMILPTS
ncbi:MAG TPA: 3'(2'),5'-bisphosphate nucleotidase CysQ [Acidobacteriota bacterium]|nr:3'(2'),5'-bisphosphate nucleotidase CysQ [Acidobacteriota bacterium]